MNEALIGLAGVVVGVFVTSLKEWVTSFFSTRRRKRYLVTRVVSLLEIFVDNCALVVKDDGLYRGQPDKDGYYFPQIRRPEFTPLSLDVDWLSIPSSLMHDILYLPNEIYMADAKIDSVAEVVADPPYFEELFVERHYQYSKLALKAVKLISQLCAEANIKLSNDNKWFEDELFEDIVKNNGGIRK